MKKLIAMLLVGILALSATAFAATYNHDDDITFEYDDKYFEVSQDDHPDDEDLVLLKKDNNYIIIHLHEMKDGETFPKLEEIETENNAKVETMETWANYKNVLTYAYDADGFHEEVFIAPVYDDDGEIDAILTVNVGNETIEDEEAAIEFSDKVSDVINTLKVDD